MRLTTVNEDVCIRGICSRKKGGREGATKIFGYQRYGPKFLFDILEVTQTMGRPANPLTLFAAFQINFRN